MASVSTYLNFTRDCEAAFKTYQTVFGTDYVTPINRFGDRPPQPGCAPASDTDKQLVMHVALPILGGHVLMGSDCPDSMGMKLSAGNNVFIALAPDTRAETERLFNALAKGGSADMPLQDMFWGDYFGTATDAFGVKWMFNCAERAK